MFLDKKGEEKKSKAKKVGDGGNGIPSTDVWWDGRRNLS